MLGHTASERHTASKHHFAFQQTEKNSKISDAISVLPSLKTLKPETIFGNWKPFKNDD